MQGDPAHGAYVIYAKASAGCEVPTHQAFDIHYIDASGKEVPFEQAVASKKKE
jgi:hypothetical protein